MLWMKSAVFPKIFHLTVSFSFMCVDKFWILFHQGRVTNFIKSGIKNTWNKTDCELRTLKRFSYQSIICCMRWFALSRLPSCISKYGVSFDNSFGTNRKHWKSSECVSIVIIIIFEASCNKVNDEFIDGCWKSCEIEKTVDYHCRGILLFSWR